MSSLPLFLTGVALLYFMSRKKPKVEGLTAGLDELSAAAKRYRGRLQHSFGARTTQEAVDGGVLVHVMHSEHTIGTVERIAKALAEETGVGVEIDSAPYGSTVFFFES